MVAIVLYALPLLQAFSALFPSDPAAKVSSTAYLYFLAVIAVFLFLCWATYRILMDRPRVTYPLLAVGAVLVLFGALQIVSLLQLYLAWTPISLVEPSTYLYAMIVPGLGIGTGIAAIVAGALALPRRVDVTASV